MERLSDLTNAMAHKAKMAGAMQYMWLLLKHAKSQAGLLSAAQESKRFALTGRELEMVLMSAVATGTTTDATWAQELAPYSGLTQTWVKSITAQTILGKLAYMRAPFRTSIIADVSPGSANWVSEGGHIPMSAMSLTATTALDMKKVAALVAVTDELLQSWGPGVQQNLEDLIGRVVRYKLDQSLLDPDLAVSGVQPASLTNGIAAGQSTGASAAQSTADIVAMLAGPLGSTGAPERIVIVMSPPSALHLSQLLTAGGAYAFPNLGALGGDIFGVPTLVSPAAKLLGSPAENIIAAIDGSRIVVADDSLMLVSASKVASLQFSDAPSASAASVSLFQSNATALRIFLYKNFIRANASAVSWFPTSY